MHITITDIVGEKRIYLAHPIKGKEVAIVTVFSDNVQYQIWEPMNVLLITNEEKRLPKGTFTGRELSAFVGSNLITTPLDTIENIVKMDKLAGITEIVISVNELNNSDNLEDGKPCNILLRRHMTSSEEFTNFEPVSPQHKKLKNGDFTSLNLKIMGQKDNGITNGPGMTMVLHIR